MKKLITAASIILASAAQAAVSFTGVALLNVPGIAVGDVGIFLIDTTDAGTAGFDIWSPVSSIAVGASLTSPATYGDGGYVFMGTKTAATAGSNITLAGGISNIPLANGVGQGDRFAVVTFDSSTTIALAGDTFKIWTDPTWIIPADGSTLSFQASVTTGVKQLGVSATPVATGGGFGMIPEPSSFATAAGLMALGLAAICRRAGKRGLAEFRYFTD